MSSLPIQSNEVLLKHRSRWLHFANPYRVVVASNLEDVLPALQEIEEKVKLEKYYAAGFLSYESAAAFDDALPTQPISGFPYLWLGLYPQPHVIELPEPESPKALLNWQSDTDHGAYHTAIANIKDHIATGRTYQVNYTMRLQANFTGSTWDFFLHIAQKQNQYAAYIDTGRHVICSASPELFFELNGDRITSRPMKGTTLRGRTTTEDQERSEWLKNSKKNRAENVMIVDMIRNDLGRIARIGSVHVSQLFETERYPTLWQLTSTVTAETDCSLAEIFMALFPCASITGAPKVNTMKIIADIENTPRKIYTGSIGFFSPERSAQFNVAIRTLLVDRESQRAEYGIGGGIVWDSTGPDEYAEALLKARLLVEQDADFSLLETMLWTPEEGFFLRKKHITRMLDSANYFGISLMKEKLEEYLNQISSDFHRSQLVRILLDQSGNLSFETRPFESFAERKTLKVCLAKRPVDSSNVFLFHKTTKRDVYESAREGLEQFDDVLLYNERDELTEFTIGNLVLELDGHLATPHISCGVLAGTYRAHLIETSQVVERTIKVQQLRDCTKVFRVNSIRKLQEVEIQMEHKIV